MQINNWFINARRRLLNRPSKPAASKVFTSFLHSFHLSHSKVTHQSQSSRTPSQPSRATSQSASPTSIKPASVPDDTSSDLKAENALLKQQLELQHQQLMQQQMLIQQFQLQHQQQHIQKQSPASQTQQQQAQPSNFVGFMPNFWSPDGSNPHSGLITPGQAIPVPMEWAAMPGMCTSALQGSQCTSLGKVGFVDPRWLSNPNVPVGPMRKTE